MDTMALPGFDSSGVHAARRCAKGGRQTMTENDKPFDGDRKIFGTDDVNVGEHRVLQACVTAGQFAAHYQLPDGRVEEIDVDSTRELGSVTNELLADDRFLSMYIARVDKYPLFPDDAAVPYPDKHRAFMFGVKLGIKTRKGQVEHHD